MLTIYKASDGSGKTFTLSVEYIRLLLKDPTSYRRILAVTFTNKATEEMKTRILKDLYDIGYVWEKRPDDKGIASMVGMLMKDPETGRLEKEEIVRRARMSLQNILHDYSSFNISTIDKYFQRVLRNLARELGLTANLVIDLNDKEIIQQAVDNLFVSLAEEEKKDVLDFIVEYARKNVEDGEDWNIRKTVKDFAGKNLPTDFYRENRRRIHEAFRDRKKIRKTFDEMREFLRGVRKMAESLTEKIERYEYGNELKNGTARTLKKIKTGEDYEISSTLRKCLEDASGWSAKKNPHHDEITTFAEMHLQKDLRILIHRIDAEKETIESVRTALRNFYSAVMLNEISGEVQRENIESNRFLLSDTQQLLKEMIGEEDTPFIFEKTGAFLEHVMIDEFQDTSRSQWRNFEVLLKHIESSGGDDLVVGDIKQSIYRWRNGDWRLLAGLDKGQGGENAMETKSVTLGSNWRSSGNVVAFNNAFFSDYVDQTGFLPEKPAVLYEKAMEAYGKENVQQAIEKRKGKGLVRVTRLTAKKGEKPGYNELCLKELDHTIRELAEKGVRFKSKEVAILTRTNGQIPDVAAQVRTTLDEMGLTDVRITSDLAFCLDSSKAVRAIISALYLATDTERKDKKKAYAYHRAMLVAETSCAEEDPASCVTDATERLPEGLKTESDYQQMGSMSLMEIVTNTVRATGYDQKEWVEDGPFLSAFMDEVKTFATEDGDLKRFLAYWEESLHKKTIQIEEGDGIRILTIHKSKGLEYDNVILFNANWKIEHTDNIWVENTQEEGLCSRERMPVLSIYKKKETAETFWSDAYEEEHLQTFFDSLNMLYVALTRAKRNLFICCKENGDTGSFSKHILFRIQQLTESGFELCETTHELKTGTDTGEGIAVKCWEYGAWEASDPATAQTEEKPLNVFDIQPEQVHLESFHTGGYEPVFWQSNGAARFDPEEATNGLTEIETGNVVHDFLSYLTTANDQDIAQALTRLKANNRLAGEPSAISESALSSRMRRWMKNETVSKWFAEGWILYNECSILSMKDGQLETRRPDRVMVSGAHAVVVDYKTGHRNDKHQKQVREYMDLLKKLGYNETTGYVWYFMEDGEDAIVRVE